MITQEEMLKTLDFQENRMRTELKEVFQELRTAIENSNYGVHKQEDEKLLEQDLFRCKGCATVFELKKRTMYKEKAYCVNCLGEQKRKESLKRYIPCND